MSKWSGRGQPNTRKKLFRVRAARRAEQAEDRVTARLPRKWLWHQRELERMTEGCDVE
jgi:hypothetical protein